MDITLDQTKQHLPIVADKHIECVVCIRVRSRLGATRSSFRHESQIHCSTCNVALCLNKKKKLFPQVSYRTNLLELVFLLYHTELVYQY